MAHTDDLKRAVLEAATSRTDLNLHDLELVWLNGVNSLTQATNNFSVDDLWYKYLKNVRLVSAEGNLNDMKAEWLTTEGYTQKHLNDKFKAMWAVGIPV